MNNLLTTESLIISISIVSLILIIVYSYGNYVKFKKKQMLNVKKVKPTNCPDYWDSIGEHKCRNIHKIGKCGLNDDVDFNDKMFQNTKTGDYMKCRYSKYCNTSWEGIDDLC